MEGYLVFLNDNISSVHNISSLWSYIEKSRTFADLVLLPLKNLRKMVQILVANVGCIAMLPSFQTSPISDIWYNNSLVSYDVSYMYTSQFSMYDDRGEESLRAIELHLVFKMQKMYSPYITVDQNYVAEFWEDCIQLVLNLEWSNVENMKFLKRNSVSFLDHHNLNRVPGVPQNRP